MIDTILFDFGAVLYEWAPDRFVAALRQNPEEARVLRAMIDGPDWVSMDRGQVDQDTALASMLDKLPVDFHADMETLVRHWYRLGNPIPEMGALASDLLDRGYRVFLFSNINETFERILAQKLVPVLDRFTGLGLSYKLSAVKPEPEIFQAMRMSFDLQPERCFFIDDRADNISAAKDYGMSGYVFAGDVADLRNVLTSVGVRT